MKRIEELINLKSISCKNKETSDELKELHYKANQILFRYIKRYAFKDYTEQLEKELTDIFIEINKCSHLNWKQNQKREEILSIGRTIIKTLKAYNKEFKYILNPSIEEVLTKQLLFCLFQYSKHKEQMGIEDKLMMLKENNTIIGILLKYNLSPNNKSNNTNLDYKVSNFFKLQEQLAEQIKDEVDKLIHYI